MLLESREASGGQEGLAGVLGEERVTRVSNLSLCLRHRQLGGEGAGEGFPFCS